MLSIILSFYLVGLSFMPCEDEAIQENENSDLIVYDSAAHSDLSDNCTPFCQCHCCHVHVLNFESPAFEFESQEIFTLITDLTQNSGIEIPHSHFQPPQV